MKITVERTSARETHNPQRSPNPPTPSDLSHRPNFPRKPPRRKIKNSGAGVSLKREPGSASAKRSSRPETPLLRWKFDEGNEHNATAEKDSGGPKSGRRVRAVVSARKLAAGLWRLHLPEFQVNGGQRIAPQSGDGRVGFSKRGHHIIDRVQSSPTKDLVHSPNSVSGPKNGIVYEFDPSHQFSNSAMEGVTKWDPIGSKKSDEFKQIFSQPKNLDQRAAISALQTELDQARARIDELETERRSSKKKLEQFLQKLSEERAVWRSREHEKIRAIIDDMKSDLTREKKNCQRLEMVNSKLFNELSDAKKLAKRYIQEYGKERKDRQLIEEVCDELAKEIEEDKAEVEAVKRESIQIQEEVEEERKMLQMAEVWREERVQMKLVDAKVMLEEKYSQMNKLVTELESFLKSKGTTLDMEEIKKAEFLWNMASSVNIQDVRELTYEPPNSDDIFSILEDVTQEREGEIGYSPASHASKVHTVSPEVKMLNQQVNSHKHSNNVFMNRSGELEEDASEWETVSHPGSSYSPIGSDKLFSRNGPEWEERTPSMEISEVGPIIQSRNLKKVSSISRLWKSGPNNGDNYKIASGEGINGRLSSGLVDSSDHGSGKDGLSPGDLAGQWSSPELGNPHMNRGMKGCIEWPRHVQKSSLKARLLEARMGSQKVQLRQVLKQKI